MPLDSLTVLETPLLGVTSSVTGQFWCARNVCRRTADAAVQRFGLEPLLADIVVGRGVGLDEIEAHLAPSLKRHLPDPSTMMEMDEAVARLTDAITRGEVIGIFGDYDVDGTSAAALLTRYLRAVGQSPLVHLPDRFTEGYGPSPAGLQSLTERGATLIITVDCGSNHGDVLEAVGADIIVLDHHLMTKRPSVAHLINPQRPGDHSGLQGLSAGGVTFMTLVALNRVLRSKGWFAARQEPNLIGLLDLVALSLIADVMPLRGLTRTLVAQGLKLLGPLDGGGGNLGLRALASVAGLQGEANVGHLGFQLGPRINAAGRVGHASTAFDLLVTDDPLKAASLAQQLEALNKERRALEDRVRRAAIDQVEASGGNPDGALVAAGEGWHPGVVGIVAGRLKEHYHKPAFCLAMDGERGTGSGRSVPGIDLGSVVADAAREGVVESGGGHAMAAGLTLTENQLAPFKAFVDERLGEAVAIASAERTLVLDGVVGVGAVDGRTCAALKPAGPFGAGNPEPRFALGDVTVRHHRVVGDRHLSLTVENKLGQTARCIAFGVVGEPLGALLSDDDRARLHLAGRIVPDTWRGGDAAQFQIDDAQAAGPSPAE